MRIKQGTTDQYVYFVGVDVTDLKTRETGLTGWVVYYSIKGGTSTIMTTPTVNETDVTNAAGVYELLIDESGMTTLAAGDDTSELMLHIVDGSALMAPVTRVVEVYREETTAGNTLDVNAAGEAGLDLDNTSGTWAAAQFAADFLTAAKIATDAVNEIRDSILSDATTFAGANINATISSRATPAQVNTEVLDVMDVDTLTEATQGVPPTTLTFFTVMRWIWASWNNKETQTATEFAVYNRAGTKLADFALSDDGTTVTKANSTTGA